MNEHRVSAVLVTHRSAQVCPGAVAALRREAVREGIAMELVIVDHSEDSTEVTALRALTPDHLVVQANLGFAAGVNAGLARAAAPVTLLVNPDVELHGGSLGALLCALDQGLDVVAPQFELAGFRFAIADSQTPGEHFTRALAGLSCAAWRLAVRSELSKNRTVWDALVPVEVASLSGACLAFRRDLFARVGPWDEGYFLYFEETDWLRRVRHAGGRLAVVPAAGARHEWGHAADPAVSFKHYETSRRRFFAAHHPVLGRSQVVPALRPVPLSAPALPEPDGGPAGRRWWLLSPTPLGIPAAGFEGTWAELLAALDLFAAARPRAWTYLVCGPDFDGHSLVGPWTWRVGNG